MFKKVFVIFFLLFSTFLFSASEFDKDIVVKNQSRNDKVKTVFREMMDAYEEEDIGQFFSYVSEDRFQQDYMTFYDAIDEDIRIYDILNIDTWVNKITDDGVKRFLEVQWEKRYESSKPVRLNESNLARSDEYEIVEKGTTEFLFDEINGKYKLIKLSGNNFWGGSLEEWTEEVGDIAGQESKEIVGDNVNGTYGSGGGGGIPDLTVTIISTGSSDVSFSINNIGVGTAFSPINYQIDYCGNTPDTYIYTNDITAGDDSGEITKPLGYCSIGGSLTITIDQDNLIIESDETNNQDSM
ncbi:MAG TPA: hypothetical protein EYG83_01765 [Sulfurospirillum arcachonense]|nr:hypothetical protein [Sulfurospirillum arcachonense]